jgi:hypothetical protein
VKRLPMIGALCALVALGVAYGTMTPTNAAAATTVAQTDSSQPAPDATASPAPDSSSSPAPSASGQP